MTSAILAMTVCACGLGEQMLLNCSTTASALCWPCDAGYACDGTKISSPCVPGATWSARGSAECTACSARCPGPAMMLVLQCTSVADRVCADCPAGYGCVEDHATLCPMNTYSNGKGTCVHCPVNTSSLVGSTGCTRSACAPDEFMTADAGCQACPEGFECDAEGVARPCRANWYSSGGKCVECDPNAVSPERSTSVAQCACLPGYVNTPTHECLPCASGTVWRNGSCVLCEAGHYCVGRTHQDVCPTDTYSTRGSPQCVDCRPFSGCAPRRTTARATPATSTTGARACAVRPGRVRRATCARHARLASSAWAALNCTGVSTGRLRPGMRAGARTVRIAGR